VTDAPTSALEDRHYLCLTIPEYKAFAEALANNCFLDGDAKPHPITKATTKKLKNLRSTILKEEYLMKSLIWNEQVRLIERELHKRRSNPRYAKTIRQQGNLPVVGRSQRRKTSDRT
jgi:hypothetical protein